MRHLVVVFLMLIISQKSFSLIEEKGKITLEKLEDYDLCQKHDYSGDWCHEAMKDWVKSHSADAFKAAKMTRLKMNAWVALPFFEQAFKDNKSDCKDKDLQQSVISGLELPASTNSEIVGLAKKISIERCYPEMKDLLLKSASITSYLFKNICKDLVAKGLLSGLKLKKCEEIEK